MTSCRKHPDNSYTVCAECLAVVVADRDRLMVENKRLQELLRGSRESTAMLQVAIKGLTARIYGADPLAELESLDAVADSALTLVK